MGGAVAAGSASEPNAAASNATACVTSSGNRVQQHKRAAVAIMCSPSHRVGFGACVGESRAPSAASALEPALPLPLLLLALHLLLALPVVLARSGSGQHISVVIKTSDRSACPSVTVLFTPGCFRVDAGSARPPLTTAAGSPPRSSRARHDNRRSKPAGAPRLPLASHARAVTLSDVNNLRSVTHAGCSEWVDSSGQPPGVVVLLVIAP